MQIFTGAKCSCKRGQQRDNCPNCEGTGKVIDFKAIRKAVADKTKITPIVLQIKMAQDKDFDPCCVLCEFGEEHEH